MTDLHPLARSLAALARLTVLPEGPTIYPRRPVSREGKRVPESPAGLVERVARIAEVRR